jgi:hypothetical protein
VLPSLVRRWNERVNIEPEGGFDMGKYWLRAMANQPSKPS